MKKDKWFNLYNEDIIDIERNISKLKSGHKKRSYLAYALCGIGGILVGGKWDIRFNIIGSVLVMLGIAIIIINGIQSHNQLCLYKMLREIKKPEEKNN